jgi:hypothetical protein
MSNRGASWFRTVRTGVTAVVLGIALAVFPDCSSDGIGEPTAETCGLEFAPCQSGSECCSGVCAIVACACIPTGQSCVNDSECCAGDACVDGLCGSGCRKDGSRCTENKECCSGGCEGELGNCQSARCNTEGEPCGSGADCCNQLACREGRCAAGCGVDLSTCTQSADCCGGYGCEYGECVPICAYELEVCDPEVNRLCCEGEKCVAGICHACSLQHQACSSDSDCCDKMRCTAGTCTCTDPGAACSADSECCPGTECLNGVCACAPIGERCSTTEDCCNDEPSDLVCNDQGRCRPRTCHANTWDCLEPVDCCGGGCENGSCCAMDNHECDLSVDVCCTGLECWIDTFTCRPCGKTFEACHTNHECCSGACLNGQCRAVAGEPCATTAECVPYTTCDAGVCCGTPQASCLDSAECCAGYVCIQTHCVGTTGATCVNDYDCEQIPPDIESGCHAGKCCHRAGTPCSSPSECCTGACAAGQCTCGAIGTQCTLSTDCCTGSCAQATGLCECKNFGSSCTTSADCCAGLACPTGTCCTLSGQPCVSNAACCSGICKTNGTCS